MSKELKKVEQVQPTTPATLIEQAINKGLDVDKMTKLFDLQERWEASQAKKAFDEAMAKLQAELPEIKKTKRGGETKSGQLAYMYAPIESIVAQTKKVISKHGFSYTIKTEFPGKGEVKSICIVRHEAGHSETSEMVVPLGGGTSIMSQAQIVASASTFSKRYAFINAFGIMTGDEDDDGASEADPQELEVAKEKLSQCLKQDELLKEWNKLSKEMRGNKELIILANKKKKEIAELEKLDKEIK